MKKLCVSLALFCVLAMFSAIGEDLAIVAGPYLQYPTQTSMIVRWETNVPASAEAGYGAVAAELTWKKGEVAGVYHEVKLENLEISGDYFYQVRSEANGAKVESEVYTFQTAVAEGQPFSFIVLGDTQSNPAAVSKLASMAWSQRPQFTIVVGDLVSDGNKQNLWQRHFFRNMQELNTRVALIPVLGNHDEDAHFFYDYFSLPDPEYHYSFSYGNAEFFMVDSQRPLDKDSEQYAWLDKALGESKATWKIICHHRPAYSSDEDDYGDTTQTRSSFGDERLRDVARLAEKHGVDIVWNGHIHSYERTWPMREDKAVLEGGVLYMITGGGGGGLEKAGPWRSPFSAKVYSGHHYCLVNVLGPELHIETYDLEGRLFDFVTLRK